MCEDGISRGGQYSSLCEGAAVLTLGVVDVEDGVQVRVKVECGREEVNDGEKHGERQNEEATRNRRSNAHHGWHEYEVMRAYRHLSQCSVMHMNYEV